MFRSTEAILPLYNNGFDANSIGCSSQERSKDRVSGKKLKSNNNDHFVASDLRFLTCENVRSENSFMSPKPKLMKWAGRNLQ
jgi:hypothetical protein